METGESEQVKGTLKDSMYSCVLPCDSGTKQYCFNNSMFNFKTFVRLRKQSRDLCF